MAASIVLNKPEKVLFIKHFLWFFLLITLMCSGVFALFYQTEFRNNLTVEILNQKTNVQIHKSHIEKRFSSVVDDLRIITGHHEPRYFLDGIQEEVEDVSSDYLHITTIRAIYDQIRYLNAQGLQPV